MLLFSSKKMDNINISRLNPLFVYLRKQRENQRFMRYLEISATFILITFFAFFALKPTFFTISKLLGEIKSKQNLTQQLREKIDDVIIAQDLFSQVQERYYLVDASLPESPGLYRTNSQINYAANSSGLNLSKLEYNLDENDYYSVSINSGASFSQALSLLGEILNNRRLTELQNLSFAVDEASMGAQQINMTLPLKVFYWPQNE